MKIRRPGGPLSGKKPKITGHIKAFKGPGGKWMSVPEEHDCNQAHPGMTHTEWKEDQKIEAQYAEAVSYTHLTLPTILRV